MEEIKKEITLEDIANLIKENSAETIKTLETKIDSAVEGLATSTQNQFLDLKKEISDAKTELAVDIGNVKADLNKKVDRVTHNDLVHRVEKLEEKTEKYDGLFPHIAKASA